MNINDLREGTEIFYIFRETETKKEFAIEVYVAKDHATYLDYLWVALHAAEDVCDNPILVKLTQDPEEDVEIY